MNEEEEKREKKEETITISLLPSFIFLLPKCKSYLITDL